MSVDVDANFENLKSRLQQNPDSLIFARVADGLLNQGQVDEAVRICEEGIRKHPYYVTGHMVLGKCYLQKKLFDLAEKEFKRVILFDPKYIAAHKFYGDLMREVGWDNTCEMSYRKIMSIDPLDLSAQQMLETLESVKPREQEIVTPGQTEEASSPRKTKAPATTLDTPTESINIEDDLFADVDDAEEKPASTPASQSDSGPAKNDKEITTILEDIFEDDVEQEDGAAEEDVFDTIDELNIKISHRPSAKHDEAPAAEPPKTDIDLEQPPPSEPELPKIDLDTEEPLQPELEANSGDPDNSDDDTLEFNEMVNLAAKAGRDTDDLDASDLEEAPSATAESDEANLFDSIEEEVEQQIESLELPELEDEDEDSPAVPEPAQKPDPAQHHAKSGSDPAKKPSGAKAEPEIFGLDDEPAEPDPDVFAFDDATDAAEADVEPELKPEAELPVHEARPETVAGSRPKKAPFDREKIVTPTLGEIYAAQGQYAKAINVFEVLLKKDTENATYQDKIAFLKRKMEEAQSA